MDFKKQYYFSGGKNKMTYLETLEKSLYSLVTETSTNLPKDVRRAIKAAKEAENAGTRAAMSLDTITTNIVMAEDNVSPICQDTGLPTFKVYTPFPKLSCTHLGLFGIKKVSWNNPTNLSVPSNFLYLSSPSLSTFP